MSKVITANTLATGHVVFLGHADIWVSSVDDAILFDNVAATEASMSKARHDVDDAIVVDPFVTNKGPETDGKAAMTLRDTIRAYGPTIHYLPRDETATTNNRPVKDFHVSL